MLKDDLNEIKNDCKYIQKLSINTKDTKKIIYGNIDSLKKIILVNTPFETNNLSLNGWIHQTSKSLIFFHFYDKNMCLKTKKKLQNFQNECYKKYKNLMQLIMVEHTYSKDVLYSDFFKVEYIEKILVLYRSIINNLNVKLFKKIFYTHIKTIWIKIKSNKYAKHLFKK